MKVSVTNDLREASMKDGVVFVMGPNSYGQCGTDAKLAPVVPFFSALKFPEAVKSIACGLMHSAIVTESGRLWTMGRNNEAQLGHGDSFDRNVAEMVKFPEVVDRVCCGNYHTTIVTANGKVADAGRGSFVPTHLILKQTREAELKKSSGHGFQFIDGIGEATLVTAAGNASCVFSQKQLKLFIWGWGGGVSKALVVVFCFYFLTFFFFFEIGHVNEVPELNGKVVEMLCGSKFEILAALSDGRVAAIWNEEVADPHVFHTAELKELHVLQGFSELAVGNFCSGAITLTGEAVSWKRNNSTGAMSTMPVRIAQQAFTLACGGSDVITIGIDGAQLSNGGLVRGRFSRVACGQFHSMLLSGQYLGSSSFVSDTQALLFCGECADITLCGVRCHSLFLRDADIASLDLVEEAFQGAPEHLIRAFLLYLYTDRLNLDDASSAQLLSIVSRLGGPTRLISMLSRQPCEASKLAGRLWAASSVLPGDLTLSCDDGQLQVHLCLLAARSNYFSAAGSDRWGVKRALSVPYSVDAFLVFVRFCSGFTRAEEELLITLNNVADVLQLASEYGTGMLLRLAEHFLLDKLSLVENLAELKQLAELLSRDTLVAAINALL